MVGATFIAEVQDQYRTLAAVDVGWLCKSEPLERCLQVLSRLQANSNRVAITQELQAAARKSVDFWTGNAYQVFPFFATCLLVGSSFDLVKGYRGRAYPLSFNAIPVLCRREGRMGYTIIDISDVSNIRYCFSFASNKIDTVQPQAANVGLWEYSRDSDGYDSDDSDNAKNDQLFNEQCLSVPEQYCPLVQRFEAYDLISKQTLLNWLMRKPEESDEDKNDAVERPTGSKSLRSQLMDRVLDPLVFNPFGNLEILGRAPEVFDLPSELRRKMAFLGPYRSYDVTSSPALMSCFELAFAHESIVDLSPYTIMPAASLVAVAVKLLANRQVHFFEYF
ncbi:MAG: hypothetical protein Q9204_007578 [Flavoplaca sp. TL-2023a]